jgi:3-oxoadipate enol-lactonase
MLVMWGDLDTDGTQRMGAEMSAVVSGARSVVFPGVAHMVNLEQPERFTQEVLAFLDEVDGSSASPGA